MEHPDKNTCLMWLYNHFRCKIEMKLDKILYEQNANWFIIDKIGNELLPIELGEITEGAQTWRKSLWQKWKCFASLSYSLLSCLVLNMLAKFTKKKKNTNKQADLRWALDFYKVYNFLIFIFRVKIHSNNAAKCYSNKIFGI